MAHLCAWQMSFWPATSRRGSGRVRAQRAFPACGRRRPTAGPGAARSPARRVWLVL